MNFSKHHTLSKVLSLILVLTLMSSLFAGCKKEDPSANTSGDTNPGLNLDLSNTSAPTDESTQPVQTQPSEVNENMATVVSQINIRSSPSTDALVVGNLYAGDRVEIIRREEVVGYKWGYITSPVTGWIVMDYVEMDVKDSNSDTSNLDTPASTAPAETTPNSGTTSQSIKGVITASSLIIRSEGSTNGNIVGSYDKGDVVTILETKNGWGRTDKGWIKMDYVNTSGTNNTTNNSGNTGNTGGSTSNISGNGSTTVQLRGIVTAKELNIRSAASQDSDRLGSYTYGDRVEILEKSGNWGRTSKGWISLSYVYQDGTTGTNTAKGVITAEGGLRIRTGPGTGYDSVGSYAAGETVTILEQFTYDGVKWGCTSKGWISMKYVDVDGDDDDNNTGSGGNSSSDSNSDEVTGTVTATGGLRIRSGPGSDYEVVGSLKYGDEVVILRRETVNDTTWGKISQGWISMAFVDLD